MFLIAFKNLLQEKTKFLLSIGGVSFAIVLMIVLLGVYEGFKDQFVVNIIKNPADMFVVQEGIRDFFHGVSIIPNETGEKIKNIEGVREAVPLIGIRAIVELNEKKWDLLMFSFEQDSNLGAPWNIVEGTDRLKENQIVIDERFARDNNLQLEDRLIANSNEFTIVGMTKGTASIITSFAFIRLDDARKLSSLPNSANYYSVVVDNPEHIEAVKANIEKETEDLKAFTKQEFVDNNMEEIEEGYLPIVWSMVVIAFVVGVAIIALTVYTATIDKSREYGILKAVGIRDIHLYQIVFYQSLISSILGFFVGVGLSFGIGRILDIYLGLTTDINQTTIIYIFIVVLVMSVIATFVPVRRITNIDPAEVFKS